MGGGGTTGRGRYEVRGRVAGVAEGAVDAVGVLNEPWSAIVCEWEVWEEGEGEQRKKGKGLLAPIASFELSARAEAI
jgi:hypothetical protein